VRMTKPDSEVLVLVEADEAGVKLSSRESPGFLADLSQGFAAFENVSISNEQTFSDAQLPENFQYSEPYHVLTALNAFMISQTLEHGGDPNITTEAADSLRMVGDLLELGGDEFFLGVADLDARTTETARRFEEFLDGRDEALLLRWRKIVGWSTCSPADCRKGRSG
jgi:hypothetical protein